MTPIRILLPSELIAMTWDITSAARVTVFQPCPSNVVVLLINLKLNILEEAFSLVCDLKPRGASTNTDHSNVSFGMQRLLRYTVAIEILIIPLILMVSVAGRNGSFSVGSC